MRAKARRGNRHRKESEDGAGKIRAKAKA